MEIKVGGIYRHYKGALYQVIALSKHTELAHREVVYIDSKGEIWNRPLKMWFEDVDGVSRFTYLDDQLNAFRHFENARFEFEGLVAIEISEPRYVVTQVSSEGSLQPLLFSPRMKNLIDTFISYNRGISPAYPFSVENAWSLTELNEAAQKHVTKELPQHFLSERPID